MFIAHPACRIPTTTDILALQLAGLEGECKKLNLKVSGTKVELQNRILQFTHNNSKTVRSATTSRTTPPSDELETRAMSDPVDLHQVEQASEDKHSPPHTRLSPPTSESESDSDSDLDYEGGEDQRKNDAHLQGPKTRNSKAGATARKEYEKRKATRDLTRAVKVSCYYFYHSPLGLLKTVDNTVQSKGLLFTMMVFL